MLARVRIVCFCLFKLWFPRDPRWTSTRRLETGLASTPGMNSWLILIVDKPLVCQRGLPGRLSTHRPALTLARRSVAAHCASLRVLATSALRAFDGQRPGRECIFPHSSQSSIHIARKACLWLLLLTGLTSACFRHRRRPPCASSIRNGRPAAPDGLQYSLAHWAYFGLFRAQRAAFVRPAKNARNDVHAVISDLSLVLPILCQCSE